ncbi:membrane protein [Sphaerisporangium krabiense]|uniref:Thiosulfate dehydrogenase [quinone] large subunit n=1 Tax=Sphaerisporangium krabiense TaxID=763782 RepID=A0A7W8Z2F2_9ACTN|nr:DoxX family membrane protein [Sphaerisporangium krabiense]MBB5626202.1 thiosulfate dehydrogenase [quinone] large subunit [Sphaerisporangium krabiense]GII66131.1 membrane protein [Sphaerisporangium krabiense]
MATINGRHSLSDLPVMDASSSRGAGYVWALARIALGWVFLWAFLDKTFGLGFSTPAGRAWIEGGSPTAGFLKGTGENALGGFFSGLAGQAWVDWLFMIGLLGVGVALILGAGLRIAAVAGGLMLVLMWAAELPLTTNPFMDEHLVYAIVLAGLALVSAGDTLGIGRWWGATPLVRKYPVLK